MVAGKCPCCGAELPGGIKVCSNCMIHVGVPAPRYPAGTWVKYNYKGQTVFNVVHSSFFDDSDGVHMHIYNLSAQRRRVVYREDQLQRLSEDDYRQIIEANAAGKLKWRYTGGWYILQNKEATTDG